jgi:hypothetical protein
MWARHLRGIVTRVYRKLDSVHYWKTAMAAPLRVLDGVGTARRGQVPFTFAVSELAL